MAAIDPIEDFIDFLLTRTAITGVVGTKIYGPPGLDRTQAETMPYKCLLVLDSGGFGQALDRPEGRQVVQCRCYGATAVEAKAVYLGLLAAVYRQFKYIAPSGYLLLRMDVEAAPTFAVEPEVGWPMYLANVEVHYASVIVT